MHASTERLKVHFYPFFSSVELVADGIFETGAYGILSKLIKPTVLGQGGLLNDYLLFI